MHRTDRRLCTLAALAAFVVVAACSPSRPTENGNTAPPAANRQPSSIPDAVDTTKDVPFDFSAADFVDARTGWVVGYDADQNVSVVLRTTDGGATWVEQVELAGDTLLDVDFVDASNGWTAGAEGLIYTTSDGGATWNVEPAASWPVQRKTKAVEVRSGGAASAPMIINESVASVFFVDRQTGWAAGDTPVGSSLEVRGVVLGTTNGGATWKELKDASGKGAPFSINDVFFVDRNEGWAAGGNQENREEDVLLHTTDGGRTWLRQTTKTAQYIRAVHFADAKRGWAVGMTMDPVDPNQAGPSKIVGTTDGGVTWAVQFTSPRSFYDVVFTDAQHGWAVGDRAAIYATSDGGATWAQQTRFTVDGAKRMVRPGPDVTERPDATAFRTVYFLDAANGWAAGDGVILKRR
jgi:photosystem II stability/assembly factor-like uncharacterized protein